MAFPLVRYIAASGDDTVSGSGPATAIDETTAGQTVSTATSTTQTFLAAVDLTGTSAGDAIWINTPAGERKFFNIVSFTGGVAACTAIVTVETADGTDGTLAWGVGGERATLQADASNRDWLDMAAGWTLEFGAGTYDTAVQIVCVDGNKTDGKLTFQAASGASPVLRTTANVSHFDATTLLTLIGLTLTTNSGTKTNTMAWRCDSVSYGASARDCIVDGLQIGFEIGFFALRGTKIFNCEIKNCVSHGVSGPFDHTATIDSCWIHDNGGDGVNIALNGSTFHTSVINCIISNNTGDGINFHLDGSSMTIRDNTIYENTDGINLNDANDLESSVEIIGNIIYTNSAHGIAGDAASVHAVLIADYNAFGDNTSGARENLAAGANDVTLTGDPFTDALSDDYSLNATAGAGAACRAAGFPGAFTGGLTTGNRDIGAVQHADPAGGGGTTSFVIGS